jgi:hypothetical protein
MSRPQEILKETNRERCRDFVRFIQDATSDGLGAFTAFEYDGWLVVATWNGSGFNGLLRDLIAADGGKPQTVPEAGA